MSTEKDFWNRIDKDGGPDACWFWCDVTGQRCSTYGVFRLGGRSWMANRLAWTLTRGRIPDGMLVCHRCDTPPCCNPTHMFLGTPLDNAHDRDMKGRTHGQRQAALRHGVTLAEWVALHPPRMATGALMRERGLRREDPS